MTQDIFIKIAGVTGEAQDASHKDEIDVLRWQWAVSQSANMHSGSGGGAGKATVYDLSFDHYCDRASTTLLAYCLTGKHIAEVVLTLRKAGGSPLEYLRITLEDAIITHVKSAMNLNMDMPRENFSLSFSRVRYEYTLQNAEGLPAGTVSMGYNIKANCNM